MYERSGHDIIKLPWWLGGKDFASQGDLRVIFSQKFRYVVFAVLLLLSLALILVGASASANVSANASVCNSYHVASPWSEAYPGYNRYLYGIQVDNGAPNINDVYVTVSDSADITNCGRNPCSVDEKKFGSSVVAFYWKIPDGAHKTVWFDDASLNGLKDAHIILHGAGFDCVYDTQSP